MKKIELIVLPLLLVSILPSCSGGEKRSRPIADNSVYDVEIPTRDVAIKDIKLVNVPTGDVEIGYLSYMGMELNITYIDDETATIPFTERLLTKEHYHLLSTPGKKSIDFIFQGNHISFDVSLVEPEVPVYHKVSYYDHLNNLISESYHRYLSSAVYNGPRVESYYEGDYYYQFNNKWDHDMEYVYCDFIANAMYDQLDVRDRGLKYTEKYSVYYEDEGQYKDVDAVPLISDYNPDGMLLNNYALFYLGELENFEIFTGETIYHEEGDFDKALGAVDVNNINLEDMTHEIVNNGYRVGERKQSSTHSFYEYLAIIDDPLWLKIDPSSSFYGMPKGIAYDVNDDFPIKSYQRKDGRYVSFDSIIKDSVISSIKDDLHEKNIQIYTSYPTGYYRVSYVLDIDLSLQTLFEGLIDDVNYMVYLNPQNSELIPGYVSGSLRPVLSYSPSGTFKERHGNPIRFDVEDLASYFGIPETQE